MHEKVREFLEKNQRDREQAAAESREKTLIQLGLWEAEYQPENYTGVQRYPEKDGERPYRKVPVPVTEEEWEEIRRCAARKKAGKMEIALLVLGVLCYLTAVFGVLDIFIYVAGFRLLWLLLWGVFGTLCLGAAEIINGLNRLRDK